MVGYLFLLTPSSTLIRELVGRGRQTVFGQFWQEHKQTCSPVCGDGHN